MKHNYNAWLGALEKRLNALPQRPSQVLTPAQQQYYTYLRTSHGVMLAEAYRAYVRQHPDRDEELRRPIDWIRCSGIPLPLMQQCCRGWQREVLRWRHPPTQYAAEVVWMADFYARIAWPPRPETDEDPEAMVQRLAQEYGVEAEEIWAEAGLAEIEHYSHA